MDGNRSDRRDLLRTSHMLRSFLTAPSIVGSGDLSYFFKHSWTDPLHGPWPWATQNLKSVMMVLGNGLFWNEETPQNPR